MARRMSCSLTIDAVRARTKTVTRRRIDTWRTLQPGEHLTLVEKAMGLPFGSRQVILAHVEIDAVTIEPLAAITDADCTAEGFPGRRPIDFAAFWLDSHGYAPLDPTPTLDDWWHLAGTVLVRRIAWHYLDDDPT